MQDLLQGQSFNCPFFFSSLSPQDHRPIPIKPMQHHISLKNRVIGFLILLAAVIIFNVLGYLTIYKRATQGRVAEEVVMVLSDQQMLSQEIVQTIAVLSIQNSFTPAQTNKQLEDLETQLSHFTSNHSKLEEAQRSIDASSFFEGQEMNLLFTEKQLYYDSVVLAAKAILKDRTGAYRNNYEFALGTRRYAYHLQQAQYGMMKHLRAAEKRLETSVHYWTGSLMISLFVALLFIALLVTAPMLKRTRKERAEAEKKIRESEEKYRHLFQTNPLPMWIYDPVTLRFLEVNQMAVQHYGYSESEFLSMSVMDIRSEKERQRLGKIIAEKKEQDRMNRRGVWTHIKKDGEAIFVDIISHDIHYGNVKAVLILANDVTMQMDLQQQIIREKVARQREIAKATIDVQERERNEIGRELHDNVNQILTTAKLHLDYMGNGCPHPEKHRTISMGLIHTAIDEIRRLSRSLVPATLKDVGLMASIEELLHHINLLGVVKITFKEKGLKEKKLAPDFALTLYRIIQEQTTNILKYAEATQAIIELRQEGQKICLEVQDNGKGFDPSHQRKGVGLANIVNRADVYQGTVDIEAAPGRGCCVKVCFQVLPSGLAEVDRAD